MMGLEPYEETGIPDLVSMGLGGESITDITQEASIADTLNQILTMQSDEDIAPILASEVRSLSQGELEETQNPFYKPYEQSEREDLYTSLVKNIAKAPTGGFAGSDIRTGALHSADVGWTGGYEDILKNIEGFKGQALEDVMAVIYGWKELLANQQA